MAPPKTSPTAPVSHLVILLTIGAVFLFYPAITWVTGTEVPSPLWLWISAGAVLLLAPIVGLLLPGLRRHSADVSGSTDNKKLEHSLTLFKRGIEQTNDAVVITNSRGEITFVNQAMEELTGYSLYELRGHQALAFFYVDREKADADTRRLYEEGSLVAEHLVRDRRGRDHAVLVRGNNIVDSEGSVIGTILIHVDLDKMRHYEAQLIRAKQRAEEASRAKSVFLANMSHEIRTPINGVLGLLRLLPEADPETQETYYRLIEEASSSLVQLIDDILDLSRIEADRLTLMPQAFAVRELLRHVSSFFAADVERKGISLSVEVDEATPETIVTDRVRLQQVLTNLIGNAVKYTEAGSVTVRAFRHTGDEDGRVTVGFEVRDTGIGISEENREKLFGFFQQVEEGYAKRYGGAGVGLAVSKRLVEMMGGTIVVDSTPGVGSTFTFTVDAVTDRRSRPREEDKQMNLEPKGGLRILLAEDNEINLLAMKVQLERDGHQITVARDGLETLDRYNEGSFDVALVDVQMPNMDGVEVVKRIREMEKGGGRLPVFAVTAYALDEQKVQFIEAGFDEVLVKPVAPGVLADYLARLWRDRGGYGAL
jgi:PAS domain S-box-containing protein